MTNNDVLRSVRFILNVTDAKLVEILKIGGHTTRLAKITAYLRKEDEPGFEECSDLVMAHFLNGLVFLKRGKDETRPPLPLESSISNNVVLKKLRVAFNLKEEDILNLLKKNGFEVSSSELSALFRRQGHTNYRLCGDQFLRNFLKGLATLPRTPDQIKI